MTEQDSYSGRPAQRGSSGVQSIERTFDLLTLMANSGGIASLSQLANESGLPLPTVHRLVRTLVDLGWVRQQPSREYALGPKLIQLGDSASRLLGSWATPRLARLVDATEESANLAVLDGDQVVYVGQAPGRHSMRMFTEVGRRAGVHCTAVGKAMLARLPSDELEALLKRIRLVSHTPNTITTLAALSDELDVVRAQGYAIDEQEQEIGVRCVAVALPGHFVRAAISVSGPVTRVGEREISAAVPLLIEEAAQLADELEVADTRTSLTSRSGPSELVSPAQPPRRKAGSRSAR